MTPSTRKRLWEILPGATVWTTLILAVVFSFVRPLWMVYFIILFDLYWLLRVLYFIPFLLGSWWKYRQALKRNWQGDLEQMPEYSRVSQVIFLPVSKEDVSVVRETLYHILASHYPSKRIIVLLAGEARYQENFDRVLQGVLPEFSDRFQALVHTLHPQGLPGEIPGKGSNLHYAGHVILPRLLELGCDPDYTIVSSFDVDTLAHPQFFSCLAYTFLSEPDRTRSSYQPVAFYNNNLWESPAPVRISMFGTTFWLMTELARPEGMMTFSSHAMSLRMLMDVDFWHKDVISEDSRIFLQGVVRYDGDYRVTPIHLPVSMDTVMTGDYWGALPALYRQLRRWAWGVENFPYMMEAFRANPRIPRLTKAWWIFKQFESMYTWATAPVLIFLLGYLPFWFVSDELRGFAIFQNTPFTLQWLMRLAMIGLFVSATLALTILPPPPKHFSRRYAYVLAIFQWALLPLTYIVFSSLPALDAQTRLLLGRRLGFNVSPKRVIPTKSS